MGGCRTALCTPPAWAMCDYALTVCDGTSFIFLKLDFGQQFKTQAVYRLRRYMYRLRRYRQQQQLLMLPHLGYI